MFSITDRRSSASSAEILLTTPSSVTSSSYSSTPYSSLALDALAVACFSFSLLNDVLLMLFFHLLILLFKLSNSFDLFCFLLFQFNHDGQVVVSLELEVRFHEVDIEVGAASCLYFEVEALAVFSFSLSTSFSTYVVNPATSSYVRLGKVDGTSLSSSSYVMITL